MDEWLMQRCLRCQGSKKIAPMGGIYVDCIVCKGIGYVPKATAEYIAPVINDIAPIDQSIAEIASETPPAEVIKKRPGRKPGWNKQING